MWMENTTATILMAQTHRATLHMDGKKEIQKIDGGSLWLSVNSGNRSNTWMRVCLSILIFIWIMWKSTYEFNLSFVPLSNEFIVEHQMEYGHFCLGKKNHKLHQTFHINIHMDATSSVLMSHIIVSLSFDSSGRSSKKKSVKRKKWPTELMTTIKVRYLLWHPITIQPFVSIRKPHWLMCDMCLHAGSRTDRGEQKNRSKTFRVWHFGAAIILGRTSRTQNPPLPHIRPHILLRIESVNVKGNENIFSSEGDVPKINKPLIANNERLQCTCVPVHDEWICVCVHKWHYNKQRANERKRQHNNNGRRAMIHGWINSIVSSICRCAISSIYTSHVHTNAQLSAYA